MRLLTLLLTTLAVFAQPRFEVASIRPASEAEIEAIKRGGRSSLFPEQGISIFGNRMTALGLTVVNLIRSAYVLRAPELSDAPDWAANESYDVMAEAESGAALSFPQVRLLLQSLLVDRFQLQFHRETKPSAAYLLVAAKNGPKLKASPADAYSTHVTVGSDAIHMTVSHATMAQLCARLSTFVGRPVVDQTGLAGVFDATLDFAPEEEESDSPSIFNALREQLGLKLEAGKAPVEVLIIERIERPTPN